MIKSIVEGIHNRDIEAEKRLHFLKGWFNSKLTINYSKALRFLELDKGYSKRKLIIKRKHKSYTEEELKYLPPIDEVVMMGYNSKFITVDRIHNAEYFGYLKIDSTTGRLHSLLTQLKKGLRIGMTMSCFAILILLIHSLF